MPTPIVEKKPIDHFSAGGVAVEIDRVSDENDAATVMRVQTPTLFYQIAMTPEEARRMARSLDASTSDRISPRQWSPSEAASMFYAELIASRRFSVGTMAWMQNMLADFIADNGLHATREGFAQYRRST